LTVPPPINRLPPQQPSFVNPMQQQPMIQQQPMQFPTQAGPQFHQYPPPMGVGVGVGVGVGPSPVVPVGGGISVPPPSIHDRYEYTFNISTNKIRQNINKFFIFFNI
jgi:hypothetical protein